MSRRPTGEYSIENSNNLTYLVKEERVMEK